MRVAARTGGRAVTAKKGNRAPPRRGYGRVRRQVWRKWTVDQFLLPLYRALKRAGAPDVTFLVYHDDHGFRVRAQLACDIRDWLCARQRVEHPPAGPGGEMMTGYVADVSGWEPWQRAYRYGVLLIYPPDPPLSAVNALRARYDPRSQATCDAHVSLTVPLPGPPGAAQWRELEAIVAGHPPLAIRYGPLMNYLPHPGVCLQIEPQADLDALRAALESASAFACAPARRYPFSAHMTIAEFITAAETEALMVKLAAMAPQGEFPCTAVSYAVPDEGFRFTERRRLALGR